LNFADESVYSIILNFSLGPKGVPQEVAFNAKTGYEEIEANS
jgi:hypothetical protein